MQLSLLSSESGAAQTKGQLPGQASECSPRVGFRCRLSYSVHTAPVCVHICSQVHNPKHQQQHCLAAQRYSSHCPNLHRQNVAAQVVGELETVTYIFVSGEKMGILKTFSFFLLPLWLRKRGLQEEEKEDKSLTHAHKHMELFRNLHAAWCVFVYRTISLACLMKNSP